MGILSSRHPILNNRGRLPYLRRRDALIISKTQRLLYCLLCYGIFSKNETFLIVPSGKTESGCKGNNFLAYLPNFPGTFFFKTSRLSGEPTGSSPKAGAKVVGSRITAKHIRKFFHQNNEVFYSNTEIQGVTKAHFPEEEGRGLGMYTIIIYIYIGQTKDYRGKDDGRTRSVKMQAMRYFYVNICCKLSETFLLLPQPISLSNKKLQA